jgi:hypothetical protein
MAEAIIAIVGIEIAATIAGHDAMGFCTNTEFGRKLKSP